jgi:membrane protein YdbS with pleckstrin-like domain
VRRIGVSDGDAMGDASGEDPCLPRSGTGDDGDERRLGRDRGALIGVEIGQQGCRVHAVKVLFRVMPYPRKLLNDNETVALDMNPHWWFFGKAVLGIVAFIILGIFARVAFDGSLETALTWVAIIGIVGFAAFLVDRYARWSTTYFVVTSDRVIYRSGVVRKHGIEIPLERVNNVSSTQSVFERILGTGNILIESGGESGQQRFTDIKNPTRVQNLIHAQRESNNTRMYGGGASAGTDTASQLEKLEGMLERGTLTQEEFDNEKRRLLGG